MIISRHVVDGVGDRAFVFRGCRLICRLLTVEDLAARWGVDVRTTKRLVLRGEVPYLDLGRSRTLWGLRRFIPATIEKIEATRGPGWFAGLVATRSRAPRVSPATERYSFGQRCSQKWLDVPGWSDYQVSDLGLVRRKAMKEYLLMSRNGEYLVVRIAGAVWQVHTLVLAVFVGERPPGLHIDHRNGDKVDNRLSNLEYVTAADNTRRGAALRQWGYRSPRYRAVANASVVRSAREALAGRSDESVAAAFDLPVATVAGIRRLRPRRRLV